MAQHVHDTAVIERRLRPIYDSLESGNTKKALQETEKVLKKNPRQQCARALKALALLRLGKDDESDHILVELQKEKPYDEATLQVMTFCYRETEQLGRICTMYAEAAAQVPGNEEILSHLFMSHVRVNDFKSQQTVALQLYKIKPKNPYYFWAVMSVVLQALRGPDKSDKTKSRLLLALAQRMVDKLIYDNKLDAAQEVQLYLSILQYQEKYNEALDFLNNPICIKLYPSVPVIDKIELMKKVNKWADVNIILKELLTENLDRWDYYKEYVESCIILFKNEDKTEGADYNFEMCHNFLCQLIEIGEVVRGPYLARLLLHQRMSENNFDPYELLGEFLELLVEYFRLFGTKPCCSSDLKIFLNYLGPSKGAGLASRLLQECGISSTTLPQSKEQMQKHICSLQISRVCGAHASLSSEHLSALSTALSLHYEHGMNAFGINLLSTDMGPSDPYALLAVYVMHDLALRSNSSEKLVEALCLLHYLLCNSPSNFHAKLLCLQIYHMLGCGWGAFKTYESLEVKHIQLDSMGYLHCALLPSIGIGSIAKHLYETTLKFFTTSYKDSVEFLAMSYKFGSFSKLQEFMDFRERLSNSLHYSLTAVEVMLLDIIHTENIISFKNMEINPSEDRINWEELTDNRDLSVIVKWNPKSEDLTNIEEESFKQDKSLLKLRSTLLRLVASYIDFCDSYATSEMSNTKNLAIKIKDMWIDLFNSVRSENYVILTQKYLVNLLPSRLHTCLKYPYEIFFNNLCNFLLDLFSIQNYPKESYDNLNMSIESVGQLICATIKEHNNSSDLIWERRCVQECIVCCIEMLSIGAFILNVGYDRLNSVVNSSHTKKSKKKDAGHHGDTTNSNLISDKSRLQMLGLILKTLKLTLIDVESALELWKCPVLSQNLTESLASMSLNPKVEVLVNGTFKDDHLYTIKELTTIIKEKIKMMSK